MPKKPYKGAINDKERSKQKLIDAVGEIIRTKGYTGLGPTNIAKCAGLNKRLIYFYFGTVDNLVETYVRGKDYWVALGDNAGEQLEERKGSATRDVLETLLINHFNYFFQEEEMQKIILWQLSERSDIMFEIAEERERVGSEFFELTDDYFDKAGVDLRAATGLLVGGIYYMILHAKSNDSLFCGIDVNSESGQKRIKNAISAILTDTYARAEKRVKN